MLIKSYAKINLSLRVLKKLKSGLHDIETNFFVINLFDEIKLKRIRGIKDKIKFKGKFHQFINKNNNSITNTLVTLRKMGLCKARYEIIVEKNIPVFAGLGGGTSNAVFLTKNLFTKKMDENLIQKLENKIGSDFRIFLFKQGFLKNLKRIQRYKKKFKLYLLIIFPNIQCSTKFIYSKIKKMSKPGGVNYSSISKTADLIKALKKDKNDLQKIVEKKYRSIEKIISFLDDQKDCYFSRMTGSGSACFGLFKTEKTAKVTQKKIKKMFPNYWTAVSRTI